MHLTRTESNYTKFA